LPTWITAPQNARPGVPPFPDSQILDRRARELASSRRSAASSAQRGAGHEVRPLIHSHNTFQGGSHVADRAHERIAALAETESKFREKIFLEYVNRDILRELEARLERAIEHLARTSAEAIDRLGDRLDGLSDLRRRGEKG
jgi:hypothetical protein